MLSLRIKQRSHELQQQIDVKMACGQLSFYLFLDPYICVALCLDNKTSKRGGNNASSNVLILKMGK